MITSQFSTMARPAVESKLAWQIGTHNDPETIHSNSWQVLRLQILDPSVSGQIGASCKHIWSHQSYIFHLLQIFAQHASICILKNARVALCRPPTCTMLERWMQPGAPSCRAKQGYGPENVTKKLSNIVEQFPQRSDR